MAAEPIFRLNGRRVWVAGHGGMVGSAVVRRLSGCDVELLTVDRSDLDLRDAAAVRVWIADRRPEVIVLAAARVGGIRANDTRPADFLFDNLAIPQSVIGAAAKKGQNQTKPNEKDNTVRRFAGRVLDGERSALHPGEPGYPV